MEDGPARPPQAEPISAVGTYGSAFVSPSQPDRSQPRGRPELAEKPCFPTEVPAKTPELPARNSPSFLHQIDRAVEGRGIHHRANHSFRAKVKGDSAEFSAEVGRKLIKERGKKVICVRQLPGVRHAQESARFSKRKLGRKENSFIKSQMYKE
ncbi:hypothetical protein Prudu_021521 [Prunus dulcis]|uniref:Uncharacterized protein n=1 Tax=Prunus dulcis TaxID=3755 RepID=A0A4Y1RXH5_PRUDU|nr:hypothetical protein Prudu_021521 [Prunus dulcis]